MFVQNPRLGLLVIALPRFQRHPTGISPWASPAPASWKQPSERKVLLFADRIKIVSQSSQCDNTELILYAAWDWSMKCDLSFVDSASQAELIYKCFYTEFRHNNSFLSPPLFYKQSIPTEVVHVSSYVVETILRSLECPELDEFHPKLLEILTPLIAKLLAYLTLFDPTPFPAPLTSLTPKLHQI